MKTVEELFAKIREEKTGEGIDSLKKLHDALLLMKLNLDPRNKFGGEYERMSKVISVSDVLYWYLIVVSKEGFSLDQILRLVSMKLDQTESGPEIKVMPPKVKNEDNT